MKTKIRTRITNNILPALGWSMLALNQWVSFNNIRGANANSSLLLLARFLTALAPSVVVLLFVIRNNNQSQRPNLREFIVAILGVFSLWLMIFFKPTHSLAPNVGLLLSIGGHIWSISASLSLGKCIGVLPAARGMVTKGHYSVVRHPMYFGQIISNFGAILVSFSVARFGVFLFWIFFQTIRAINEEKTLRTVFPEYNEYSRRVARLIPFIW